MILTQREYEWLLAHLNTVEDIPTIADEKSWSYDSILSIWSQKEKTMHIIATKAHRKQIKRYAIRLQAGVESILQLASRLNYPSKDLARLFLQDVCTSKQLVRSYLKNPVSIPTEHAWLQPHVLSAIAADTRGRVQTDIVRRVMGEEYEYVLERQLRKAGLAFIDEQKLMDQGFSKTPDVLLVIPFAVKGQEVNWIDSKAMFGSKELHRQHLHTQLQPYVNRYGPGLVIYWFGFVADNAALDPDVCVLDRFPTEIVQLTT